MISELLLLNALQMYDVWDEDTVLATGDKSKITWITTAVISLKNNCKSIILVFT